MRRSLGVIFITLLSGSVFAIAAAPAGSMPASTMPVNPFQAQLQERLQSQDPAVRAEAQKELAAIAAFWRQPDMLEQMGNATDDPALKALFKERVAALQAAALENQPEAAADPMHLPAISLSLHDASFTDVVDALNAALGGHFLTGAPGNAGSLISMEIHEKPFWEAVRMVQPKQPFAFAGGGTDLSLRVVPQGGDTMDEAQISGPAIVFAGPVAYRRTVNLQVDGAAAHTAALTIPLTLIVDPRVTVSSYGMIAISKITDETGQTVALIGPPPAAQNFVAQSNIRTQQTTIDVLVVPGKRLTVTCDARIIAATESITSTIEDVENSVNKAVALGPRSVRIAQAKVSPDKQLTMQIIASTPAAPPGVAVERVDARVQYKLLDAGSKVVWSVAGAGSNSFTTSVASATGPFKLVMTSVGKSEEIPLHFELKDIPLP